MSNHGNIEGDVVDRQKTFDRYLEGIKKTAGKDVYIIWGRPEIEAKIISNKHGVSFYFYSINEDYGNKITVIKIMPGDYDSGDFLEEENLDQLQRDNNEKVVRIVNYKKHFVPLLRTCLQRS